MAANQLHYVLYQVVTPQGVQWHWYAEYQGKVLGQGLAATHSIGWAAIWAAYWGRNG